MIAPAATAVVVSDSTRGMPARASPFDEGATELDAPLPPSR
jgi:hypothetical protein